MLSEKICLVTGAARGIGRATAIEMARQGAAAVIVSDQLDEGGEETVELVAAEGAEAIFVHCDLAEPKQIEGLVERAVERFGGLDTVHNNAGVHESVFTEAVTIETLPTEAWDRVQAINLRAPWLLTKYAVPHLRRSERGPSIVNAGSTGGVTGYPLMNAYGASKGGLIQLTRCAAVELAPAIRVNAYTPASVYTPMVEGFVAAADAAEDKEAIHRSLLASHLIPRYGKPEEVAKLVCFLASDDAAWITGSIYPIDGGALAWCGTREEA